MTDSKKETYWSKFANTFDNDQRYIVGEAIQKTVIDKLSRERDLGELIEFGCGAGFYTKVIAPNARHVIATDLSDEMLAVAKIQLKDFHNVVLEKVDCEKPGFPDGKFDRVFMANLIHLVQNPSVALKEARRILRNGGLILIVSYTPNGLKFLDRIKTSVRFIRKWGKPPKYFRANMSQEELHSLVESAGFQVEIQLIGDKTKAFYLKGRKI
jgi:ubiquinone/menaquinone biosynthesis C-methylase UbiE